MDWDVGFRQIPIDGNVTLKAIRKWDGTYYVSFDQNLGGATPPEFPASQYNGRPEMGSLTDADVHALGYKAVGSWPPSYSFAREMPLNHDFYLPPPNWFDGPDTFTVGVQIQIKGGSGGGTINIPDTGEVIQSWVAGNYFGTSSHTGAV
jgi:hypothetical protein